MDAELYGRPRRRVCAQVRAEESHCWLCGYWIDQSLPRNSKWGSTIDEIIPRSRGRTLEDRRRLATDRANLRHAHRSCNSSRGNGPPVRRTFNGASRIW